MRVWFDRRCLSGSLHCDSVLLCIIFHHFASSHFTENFWISRITVSLSPFPFSRSRYLRFMDTGKQHGHVFRLKIILVVINNHFFKVFKVFYQKRGTSQGFQGCPKHFQGFQSSQGFKVCTLGICKRTCSECYEGSERGES